MALTENEVKILKLMTGKHLAEINLRKAEEAKDLELRPLRLIRDEAVTALKNCQE